MMRVSELTGVHLNYWVARAEGTARQWDGFTQTNAIGWLNYSTVWALTGPLIDKYGVSLRDPSEAHRGEHWEAHITTRDDDCCYSNFGDGATPLEAICRAVVRAKFGDEVPDINET